MSTIALTTDLLLQSQLAGAAQAADASVAVVATVDALREKIATEPPRLVIVDLGNAGLDLPAVISEVRAAANEAAIVAFGPHVYRERLEAAREAGCDVVMSRGQFHSQMVPILQRFAR